jgi:hypothetical protein
MYLMGGMQDFFDHILRIILQRAGDNDKADKSQLAFNIIPRHVSNLANNARCTKEDFHIVYATS